VISETEVVAIGSSGAWLKGSKENEKSDEGKDITNGMGLLSKTGGGGGEN